MYLFYIKSNKCGQISRAVVWADIQTSCNIKASASAHNMFFGYYFVHFTGLILTGLH